MTSAPASGDRSAEVYNCSMCRDAGFVHPRYPNGEIDWAILIPCQCQAEQIERKKRESILKFCRLPARASQWTFEDFNAYTPTLKEAKAKALQVVEGTLSGLTLMSRVDRGKTHLAVAICNEYLKRKIPARYVFVPLMLDELRAGQYHDDDDDNQYGFMQMMNFYASVPLLVLDDIGTEKPTAWATEKLTTIIDRRAAVELPIVVTTNKPIDALPGDTEGRIGSRLRRYTEVVVIDDAPEFSLSEVK